MGEPLILLPGLSCDAAAWRPVVRELPGVTCRIAELADVDHLGWMAQAVLDAAPARFALAGHSMGGRVALEIVRRAPERVSRLALLDTGYAPRAAGDAGEHERRHRYELVAIAREHGMAAMGRRWSEPMVHPSRLADPALMEAIVDMIARSTPERFVRQVEALLARPDAAEVLATVRCPTLVLCGRDDGWANVAQHREIAARVPGSRLVVVDDCGHMAPMERPREVAQALRAWLDAESLSVPAKQAG
jgi:pimeloyl-ACP methyl ester carboxylesterase